MASRRPAFEAKWWLGAFLENLLKGWRQTIRWETIVRVSVLKQWNLSCETFVFRPSCRAFVCSDRVFLILLYNQLLTLWGITTPPSGGLLFSLRPGMTLPSISCRRSSSVRLSEELGIHHLVSPRDETSAWESRRVLISVPVMKNKDAGWQWFSVRRLLVGFFCVFSCCSHALARSPHMCTVSERTVRQPRPAFTAGWGCT